MNRLHEWKKQAAAQRQTPSRTLEKSVRAQISAAAGAEQFQNRDPVSHVTEDFQKTFDLMGTQKAREQSAQLYAAQMKEQTPGTAGIDGQTRQEQDERREEGGQSARDEQRRQAIFDEQTSMDDLVAPSDYDGDRMFLSRFSQMAFSRGTLSAAVLRGTGKMMLFSCLKRTIGQSQPKNFRQQRLFESSLQRRNVSGGTPNQVLFNRGEVDGAVGLVVDVLRDARRVVESMCDLASGKNMLEPQSGAGTLEKMYPFLADGRERALLEEYHTKLKAAEDPEEKEILQHAIGKTNALLEKKQQMKERFIVALRSVSDSAAAALATFTAPGFTQELSDALEASFAPPQEPEEPPDGEPEKEPPEGEKS